MIGAPWAEASPERTSRRSVEVSHFSTGDDDTPRTSDTSIPGTSDRPAVLMLDGTYEGEDQGERDLMEAFSKRFATVKCFESSATPSPGGSFECGSLVSPHGLHRTDLDTLP